MKIVAPLNRLDEIPELIRAGASELFCGFVNKGHWQKYANFACLNRREDFFSNLNDTQDLKKAVNSCHRHNVPLVLAINEFYGQEQSEAAIKLAKEALDCGVDALLVADLGMIMMLREKFKRAQLHLSSCATVFNSVAMKLYAEFGIKRIVLQRHFNIEEIKALSGSSNGKFNIEVFILNEKCYNLDGCCSFIHGKFSNLVNSNQQPWLGRAIKKYVRFFPQSILQAANRQIVRNSHACCFSYRQKGERKKAIFNTAETFLYACGVCNLYDFHKFGISHIKIAGRSILTDQVKNVSMIKEICRLLNDGLSRNDFLSKAKNIVRSRHRECLPERCYYFTT